MLISKIIVENSQGQILLVRRSKTAPLRAFDWEFPGGIVEDGEDPKYAAIRELEEEAGISTKTAEYIFAGTSPEYRHSGFFFYAIVDNPEPKLSYEHDKYKWVRLNEAIDIVTVKAYKTALEYYKKFKHNKVIVSTKALINYNGKTLAVRRSAGDVGGGNWDLPGGQLEVGEDLKEVIHREIIEETSLTVTKSEIIFAHTEVVNNEVRIRIGQVASVSGDKVKLSHEHDDFRWLNNRVYEFMDHKYWPGWREFVKSYS